MKFFLKILTGGLFSHRIYYLITLCFKIHTCCTLTYAHDAYLIMNLRLKTYSENMGNLIVYEEFLSILFINFE